MFKCEICHDWCSRIDKTKEWWKMAKNVWESLNGKDLSYYIAILAVLRETTKEILKNGLTSKNHSMMVEDLRGYQLLANKNCKFIPLTETQKNRWRWLFQTIRVFRNGAAHPMDIHHMKPVFYNSLMNSTDSTQDYYRYAPFPHIVKLKDLQLKKIHEFIRETIFIDVRSSTSDIPSHRMKYEIYHVERGPFIDLLHNKMTDLLKEVKCFDNSIVK